MVVLRHITMVYGPLFLETSAVLSPSDALWLPVRVITSSPGQAGFLGELC